MNSCLSLFLKLVEVSKLVLSSKNLIWLVIQKFSIFDFGSDKSGLITLIFSLSSGCELMVSILKNQFNQHQRMVFINEVSILSVRLCQKKR